MMRRILLIVLALLTTSVPATASTVGLQTILDQITADGASAALAEFRDSQTVWRGSSGHTRLGHSQLAPVNDTYVMSTQDGQAQLTLSVNLYTGNPGNAILQLIFTAFCGPRTSNLATGFTASRVGRTLPEVDCF